MNETLARALYTHGDELQHEPEYIGRGMSKPTHAVTGTQSALFDAIYRMVDDLFVDALKCDGGQEKDLLRAQYEELNLSSLSSFRMDQLGTELVFY